jgi:hypothetical protein
MPRDVYSICMFRVPSMVAGPGVEGPVVPDGLRYILRDVDARENLGTAGAWLAILNPVGGIMYIKTVGSSIDESTVQWRGRQVYQEGEQLGFEVSSGSWSIMASGYQLTLP